MVNSEWAMVNEAMMNGEAISDKR